jgi:hypothetical protein
MHSQWNSTNRSALTIEHDLTASKKKVSDCLSGLNTPMSRRQPAADEVVDVVESMEAPEQRLHPLRSCRYRVRA